MSIQGYKRTLDDVAAQLGFDVGDIPRANAAYVRWAETEQDRDRETVELWVFCYVLWYFIGKFLRERRFRPSDMDALIERAYRKAIGRLGEIASPERFASYVSVVCLNTFRNYIRRNRAHVPLDQTAPLKAPCDSLAEALDRSLLALTLGEAIERLPPSLQEVARLKFVEQRSYDYIAAATERPVPSVRAYVGKAVARFREDPSLKSLLDELRTE